MAEIISYRVSVRRHHLRLLEQLRRQYRGREEYLRRLRRMLFQIEGRLRQAEMQQWEVLHQLAEELRLPLKFPDLGDRVGLQEFFGANPFIAALLEFFTGRLTPEDCYQRLLDLAGIDSGEPEEKR